jgi:SAM-dependent methyltransferase
VDFYRANLQLAAAKHQRWMSSRIEAVGGALEVEGWVLSPWEQPEDVRFSVNGQPFSHIEWPLASPYLQGHFPDVPNADVAHFRGWYRPAEGARLFPDGFARVNVTGPFGDHGRAYRTAWFLADPAQELEIPSPERILRINGSTDVPNFLLGGATIVKRFEQLLLERLGRPLTSFEAILDWGSGAGRLARYLSKLTPHVTGIDIDPDNIRACQQSIPQARFQAIDLLPPTPFQEGAFDLVLGLSVMTHLDESTQNLWLAELKRITRPNGIVLLSIQGLVQMSLYKAPGNFQVAIQRQGIYYIGQNSQLNDVIDDKNYYKDIIHSHDYVFQEWGKYFEILDIIEAIAGNQDLVIMRRRAA